jgi:hypothetical protein
MTLSESVRFRVGESQVGFDRIESYLFHRRARITTTATIALRIATVVKFNPPSCPEIVAAGLPPAAVAGDSYCVPRLIPPILNAVPPEISPDFDGPLDALELALAE